MRDGDLQARLTHAIRHEQLTLSYQPIVSLTSGRPSGAEALARWNDEELGPVSPDVFIPVAERSGLVHELGRWVLREACLEAMRWSTDPDGPSVSVNVSPVQLARSDVIRQVADALTESGLAPARLCLEITETAAVVDLDETSVRLSRLRDLGVRVALDDFGTGFSSLTMLRRLPLDQVKIDRSFVAGLHENAQDSVVVRLAVEAAHLLGHTVCAEGVETVEQVRELVAIGCDTAQGWFFGKPTSDSREFIELADRLTRTDFGSTFVADPAQASSTPDLVTALSPEGMIRYASSSVVAVLGLRPEDLVGRAVNDLTHPGDSFDPRSTVGRSADGTVVGRVRHADGGYRWLSSSVHELRDGSGRIREYVATSRDITTLIETQQELEAVEERFRGAFDGAPIGMALSDLTGRILRVNDALAALIGHHPRDLVGMTVDDITWPEDRTADAENLDRLATQQEQAHRVRKRYLTKDGVPVPVEVWAATIQGADETPQLVVAHVMPVRDELLTPGRVVDHRPEAGTDR
jgi:PAS domain S-box-containing protein